MLVIEFKMKLYFFLPLQLNLKLLKNKKLSIFLGFLIILVI
ncbi:hypothetical protein LINPERPRIM_LOCUS8636 [Linum perenne]